MSRICGPGKNKSPYILKTSWKLVEPPKVLSKADEHRDVQASGTEIRDTDMSDMSSRSRLPFMRLQNIHACVLFDSVKDSSGMPLIRENRRGVVWPA